MDEPRYAVPPVPEPAPPGARSYDPLPGARSYEPPGGWACDPLAVAVGNASLLGVGYAVLGRRRLAVAAGAVTVALVAVLLSVARPWCEVAVVVWWAVVTAHGWYLARADDGSYGATVGGDASRFGLRTQRVVALGVTGGVLLTVGLLRYDAVGVERSVAEARDGGDCAGVLRSQHRVWFGDRLADAPGTARGDRAAHACHRLRSAGARLTAGLSGDTDALRSGFDTLAAVLAQPGNAHTVDAALNRFLHGLPARDPCHTVTVTDWLRHRRPSHDVLDRSADVVPRTAPAALVGCANALMDDADWKPARSRYQQLLDQYPHDRRAPAARSGVHRATLKIELAHVRSLLDGPTAFQPTYCSKPAEYGGAPRDGKGRNRAMIYGNDTYADRLPASWRTGDPTRAALVVCADDAKHGTSVRTCPYQGKGSLRGFPTEVTFHKIAIPVKVYALRTGKLVAHRTVEIGGASCPATLHYTNPVGLTDIGPPSDVYVHASTADVRAAFRSLIDR